MTTPVPPLLTNTGAGAVTSAPSHSGPSTIILTGAPRTSTTSGITAFTGYPSTYPIVSRYPVLVTQSGVVYISTATITLNPATARPTSFVPQSSGTPTNKGAIAGGVIGACAVIIAIIATLLWLRRRSPAHWKAKQRGWKIMGRKAPLLPTNAERNVNDFPTPEAKPSFPRQPVTDLQKEDPFRDPTAHEVEAPPPALYIREHRQPAQDPFADPQESPTSPRFTHKRGTSSINPLLPSNNQ